MDTNKKIAVVVYGYAKQNYELTIQKHFSCRGLNYLGLNVCQESF